jgi:nitrous oxide reductase
MDQSDKEMDQDIKPARRRFVGAVASGIAAAGTAVTAGAALAQQAGGIGQGLGPKRNPNYPKPPFPRQQQEWPAWPAR